MQNYNNWLNKSMVTYILVNDVRKSNMSIKILLCGLVTEMSFCYKATLLLLDHLPMSRYP